jgi:hypothetical protein
MRHALRNAAFVAATFAVQAAGQTPAPDTSTHPVLDRPLRIEIAMLSRLLGDIHIPRADQFMLGDHEVTDSQPARSTVAVARGNLSVRGPVQGDALVLHGDLFVYPGGLISGNAVAVDGHVRVMGGVVGGDVRSVRGFTAGLLARAAGSRDAGEEPLSTWGRIKLVIAWFAILAAIGIGVMLFAERNFDGVVSTLEQEFGRSFWIGVVTQLAALPALVVVVVALALSIIGVLLVPFAVVAYVVALAGLITLGFLAVARFTGRGVFRDAGDTRAVHLRSLVAGLSAYVGLWLIAALFAWSPVVGSILRAVADAGTWVAVTYGLGATVLSRAGTLRDGARTRPRPADELSWQTPSPVTGVVAARRPVVTSKER